MRKKYGFRSIRFKLVAGAVLVEILMLSILVLNSMQLAETSMIEEQEREISALLPLLNASLAGPVLQEDIATVREIAQQLHDEKGLRYILISGASGERLAEVGTPVQDKHAEDSFSEHMRKADATEVPFGITLPLKVGSYIVGELAIAIDTRFLAYAIRQLRNESIVIAGAEILLSIVLLSIIGFALTRHLFSLTDAASRLADGDLSVRVTSKSTDEIGETANTFNRMAEEIQRSRDHLEQLVAKRTANLAEAKEEAERANASKSQFLSRMSHELRTPLNSILGFAQLLEMEQAQGTITPELQKDHIEQIMTSGQHLLNLVDEVLDLASIEANKLELSMGIIDTATIIQSCVDTMLPLAKNRNITIEYTEYVNCEGCVVKADALRLKQVLLNLLSNAVKYNCEDGRITVTCEQMGTGYGRIAVTDTGSGISEEDQASLFEPFNRLYLKTYAIQGTGIGLSISKRLVELMGGSIGIESQPEEGSTFWVELELAQQTESDCEVNAAVTPIARDEANTEQYRTLLYVDDNPSHVQLLQAIVDSMPNIRLLTAHTPQLGLELAAAHKPDLIMLDIGLPGMDGYEVLNKIKENEALRFTPVIAISANAMPHDIEKGLRTNFRRYLTKPINVIEFKEAVEVLLHDSTTLSKPDS